MTPLERKWRDAARRARTPEARRKFMRRARYERLKSDIDACTNCPLSETRKNTVALDQYGPRPIALVGEAPGSKEDDLGAPFVGKSGALLDDTLMKIGHDRSEVVVMNTVACRPPRNRDPRKDESEACRPLFTRQLDFSGAWIVVLMGNKALQQIFPGQRITKARNQPRWKEGRIYIPTFHPAYLLRNPKSKNLLAEDLSLAFSIYEGRKWWDPLVKTVTSKSKETRDLGAVLEANGWARIYSKRLQDEIIVTVDTVVKVPPKFSHIVRYTVEELVRIGELGAGQRLTLGELSSIHLVKSLGGVVVQ